MKYDTQAPYLASFVILRRGNKIAFVLRQNTPWMNGFYGLPSGKVELRENASAAAIREAKEETGVQIPDSSLRHILTMHRMNQDQDMIWLDVYFVADDWEGDPYNAEPEVHAELSWLDINKLPDNVIPSVKAALEAIESGKTYAEYGWD